MLKFTGIAALRSKANLRIFITSLILITCFAYTLFTCRFAFNQELDNNPQYFAAWAVLTGWFGYVIFLAFRFFKRPISWYQTGTLLLSNTFLLLIIYSRHYTLANEYFTWIVILFILFIPMISANTKVVHTVIFWLALSLLWQLYLAFDQMDYFRFRTTHFNITGSLQNSGVLSCYLVSQLPFLYYILFNTNALAFNRSGHQTPKSSRKFIQAAKIIAFGICTIFISFIIWRSESRTAIVALGTLIFSFLAINYHTAIRRYCRQLSRPFIVSLALIFVTGICYAAYYLFNLKQLSASGRLLKLHIAYEHLSGCYLSGTGIGRFTWHYPQWQASYFANQTHPPEQYFLSASESFVLFNEYAQLLETVGLFGFGGFIVLLFLFFKTKSDRNKSLLNAAKLTGITILACGFTSYPFHVNILLLELLFCLALGAILNENVRYKPRALNNLKPPHQAIGIAILSVTLLVAALGAFKSFEQWQAKLQWDKLRGWGYADPEVRNEFGKLYQELRYDGKFLTEYGLLLVHDSTGNKKGIEILEESKKYYISSINVTALGMAYQKSSRYNKAIENYEWLSNYIPSRFGTKLALLKLYKLVNDSDRASKTANIILTMPVKMPSIEVDRIKREAGNSIK
ncbi:O-antigen ligase family protein [Chitinophaga rhizosphaerae]|uniref:O-antigen ligase family protein n=1 Tax=Chitinophaga rhizosphaerae TaxID=1864947 RepID=UPI000F7FDE5F|nr:hypothetical protein [Chitinophaga rhizosphaerae]